MITFLPDVIKLIFKFVICCLATFVFSVWFLMTFSSKEWSDFLYFMWKENE